MKKVLKKCLIILCIIMMLNNFLIQPVVKAYSVEELAADANALAEDAVQIIVGILGGLVGLLTLPERFLAVQVADAIKGLTAGIAYIDNGTNKPKTITPYEILFNKVKIVDINFFDITDATGSEEGAVVNRIRIGVAGWYYAMRNIAAAILLCILLYVGIRMALSTIASDRAMYKKMLVDWVCSLLLIFVLQYIIIFTIYCNNAIVNAISFAGNANKISAAYDKIAELAMEVFSINSFAAVVVYCMLIWQTLGLFFSYLNRMIRVAFLIVISPLISITYSIDKIGDGKAQALGNWLKDFISTVLMQPFHCAIYMCLISTSLDILINNAGYGVDDDTLAAAIIAILCIKFTKDAETLIKSIFSLKVDNKTSLAGGLAMTAMALNNAKGLGKAARGAVSGASNFVKGAKGTLRNAKIEAAATLAYLKSKDEDKTFADFKEEATIERDNKDAQKIERKTEKYRARKQARIANTLQKTSSLMNKDFQDEAAKLMHAERNEKIDKLAEEKVNESGGTMSMEAARASARKEIAKQERTNASPVRRNIKKASGFVKQKYNNLNRSATFRVLGDMAKSKLSTAVGLSMGAGMYGTSGDLAKSIMGGAAIASSTKEFLKSSSRTVVNQSMDLVDRLDAKNRDDLSTKLDAVFANPDKYDHSSKTPAELKKLLSEVDALLANVDNDKAENYKTSIRNVFSENPTNVPDSLDAIFRKIGSAEKGNVSEQQLGEIKDNFMDYGACSSIYATMKQAETMGISQESYKQSLLDTYFVDGVDRAEAHFTSELDRKNDNAIDSAMKINESFTEGEDRDLKRIAEDYKTDHQMMKLFQDMTAEVEAEQRVKAGLEAAEQKDLARQIETRIEHLKQRRDKILIEAVNKHHHELADKKSKLAEEYKAALQRRYDDLKKEKTTAYIRDEKKRLEYYIWEVKGRRGELGE